MEGNKWTILCVDFDQQNRQHRGSTCQWKQIQLLVTEHLEKKKGTFKISLGKVFH